MPLQVRLRHAIGERVIELPERSRSQPLTLGRGRDVDVQIPSITTAPRHCVLFIHEDQWFVQPMDGKVVLNGKAISGPQGLRTGDLIALGEDKTAATLQIDPIGAAERRSGPVTVGQAVPAPRKAVVRAAAPAAAPAKTPAPAPEARTSPDTSPAAGRAAAPRVEETQVSQTESGENDAVDWNLGDSVPATTNYYVPKGRQTSSAAMVITIVIGMGAVGGLGFYAYKATHKPAPPPIVIVEQTAQPKAPPAAKPKALFDIDGDQAAARQAQAKEQPHTASVAASPAAAGSTGKNQQLAPPPRAYKPPPASAVQEDPDIVAMRAQAQAFDPAWEEIEKARHDVRHIGMSVNKYDAYRRDHPGKNTAALDKFLEEAANWLYWQRMSQLWKTRDELFTEIRRKDTDLKYQPPGAFHDQLEKDRADLVAKHDQANDAITNEMGYSGDTAPDLENPTQLQRLAQSRDSAKYAAFKTRALKYVRDYHGAVWWVSP